MPDWSSAVCDANGIAIHYTRTGAGKPPLILLHGLTANGACWTPLARALQEVFDVIMPDARGHGLSGAPSSGYRYEDLANDVAGLIEALRLPPPILLGHSMGGMTAAVLASRKPNLLRALLLADPTFLSPNIQREVHASDVADQHRRMLQLSPEQLMADARKKHPHRSPETIELIARARLRTSPAAFEILTPPLPDFTALMRALAVPSLLILADRGVVSAAVGDEMKRLKPELHVEMIRDAGHGLHFDQPDRFAGIVRSFCVQLAG